MAQSSEFIQRLEAYISKKQALETEMADFMWDLGGHLSEMSDAPDEIFISDLYWNYEGYINTVAIEELLGVAKGSVAAIARRHAPKQQVVCVECGSEWLESVRTRSHRATLLLRPPICGACKDAAKARNAAAFVSARERDRQLDARSEQLRTMPYREYLQTPEWQETRQRVLRRARYKCELCSRGGRLHVHHKCYDRRGNEYSSDLIVLCPDCHAKFHGKVVAE